METEVDFYSLSRGRQNAMTIQTADTFLGRKPDRLFWALCCAALLVALARSLSGYGYDNDTYGMLRTWQTMVGHSTYEASRFQGNIVAEFILGFSAWIGGSVLSNLTVLTCSIASLVATHKIAALLEIPSPIAIIALCVTNGYFLIASSTSIDYMIAYGFFSIGLYLYLKGNLLPACVFLAISVGTRIPYLAISFAAVFGWQHAANKTQFRDLFASIRFCACLFFISGLFYLPVWIGHGLRFDWLNAATPDYQGALGFLFRFLYKGLYLFGPIGSILAALAFLFSRINGKTNKIIIWSPAAVLATWLIAANLALFLALPVEISYLIPAIPFVGIFLSATGNRTALLMLIFGNLVANCVTLQVLDISHKFSEPCSPKIAVRAKFEPRFQAGILIEEFTNLSSQDKCYRDSKLVYPYKTMWSRLPVGR